MSCQSFGDQPYLMISCEIITIDITKKIVRINLYSDYVC